MPNASTSLLRSDPADVRNHLRLLYGGDGGDAPGWLVVFTLPDRRTRCFAGDDLFGETPATIAALAESQNVYIGMALQAAAPDGHGRGTAEGALAIPGVWLDLDVQGPGHAGTHYPATRDEALAFLAELPLEPTLVVDSGGGLQVHWLFRELQVFASDGDRALAERLSKRVQDAIIAQGTARGWKIDNTADLARILRPAGTLNHKRYPPLRVRTVYQSNARYTPEQLVTLCTRQAPACPALPTTHSAPADDDRRARAYIATVGGVGEGSRDSTAIRVAMFLVNDLALDDERALAYLREWNATNTPPLPDGQLVHKIRGAKKYAKRPRGCARVA